MKRNPIFFITFIVATLIVNCNLLAQSQQYVFIQNGDNAIDVEYFTNLTTTIHSNFYMNDNGNIFVAGENPIGAYCDAKNIGYLYNVTETYPNVEYLNIIYENDQQLSQNLEINKLTMFPNVRYIIIMYYFDVCGNNTQTCLENVSSGIIGGLKNLPTNKIIATTVSIPK